MVSSANNNHIEILAISSWWSDQLYGSYTSRLHVLVDGKHIEYIDLDHGLFRSPLDSLDLGPVLATLLPPVPSGTWNRGFVSAATLDPCRLDDEGHFHANPTAAFTWLTQADLPGVKKVWHPTRVSCVDLTVLARLRRRVYKVTHPLFGDRPLLAKISEFEDQFWLEGSGVGPTFLGHITEPGPGEKNSVVGLLTEFVEGVAKEAAGIEDLEACRAALGRLHKLGIRHGDTHRYKILVRGGGEAVLIDFEPAKNVDEEKLERDGAVGREFEGLGPGLGGRRKTSFIGHNMEPFLCVLEHDKKTEDIAPIPWRYYDSTPEGKARFEAALWQECIEHFECETEAYTRLSDFQGKLIPRMYAHIAPSDVGIPADLLHPQTAPYFEVRGVLLEVIDGYTLWDIASSPRAPPDPKAWQAIIQAAADAAHQLNLRGVLMDDCAPRNVVVDAREQKPFIIDLAQCRFKDRMMKEWLEWGWADDNDDWDPDVEYWEHLQAQNNPADIGVVMRPRLLQQNGMNLDIKLPDYDRIISEIRRRKELEPQDKVSPVR